MRRDDGLDEHERHTCSISATPTIGIGGGMSASQAPNAGTDRRTPVGRMSVILFAASLGAIVLAFNNGPTFSGMFFALLSIACFGYGFGSILNSPAPGRREITRNR